MAITALTTLRDDIMLRISRCPPSYILAALRQVAVTFFRDTEVWRKELAAQDITGGEATYTLAPGVGTGSNVPDIWRILTVKISDGIIPAAQYNFDLQDDGVAPAENYNYKLVFLEDYVPTGDITDGLAVTVVLVPNLSTGWCEPFILQQWGQALIHGTLAFLFGLRSRPWGDVVEAAEYADMYEKDKVVARQERTQQFTTNGSLRASNPEGWL